MSGNWIKDLRRRFRRDMAGLKGGLLEGEGSPIRFLPMQ